MFKRSDKFLIFDYSAFVMKNTVYSFRQRLVLFQEPGCLFKKLSCCPTEVGFLIFLSNFTYVLS